MHRIIPAPVLDPKLPGIRCTPLDANGIEQLPRAQIDYDPLRMSFLIFVGEVWVEVRITLPKGVFIAIGDPGVTVVIGLVNGIAATRQAITVGNGNWGSNRTTRCPVTTMMIFIAPGPAWVPMPDFAA